MSKSNITRNSGWLCLPVVLMLAASCASVNTPPNMPAPAIEPTTLSEVASVELPTATIAPAAEEPTSAPTDSLTAAAQPIPETRSTESETPERSQGGDSMPSVNIRIGEGSFSATLHDNESARTIVQAMPFTLRMNDFAAQEKVADLSFPLPSAQTITPATINSGDLYLWSGNSLVLFYTTFSNSYSYVPVGYITDASGLRDALGSGSVDVTFSVE